MAKKSTPSEKESLQRPVWHLVGEVFQLVIILGLVIVATLTFGSRVPALSRLGINFFAVTSGSMEPTIPTGAMISVRGVADPADINVDDIITYSKTGSGQDAVTITHRVIEVKTTERQVPVSDAEDAELQTVRQITFRTQGDANEEADNYEVLSGEVIGVYQWHWPQFGHVISFVQSQQGFMLVVVIPAVALIVWELLSIKEYLKEVRQARHVAKKSKKEDSETKDE